VLVADGVGVSVFVAVGVGVPVLVAVAVGVEVCVLVGVGIGVELPMIGVVTPLNVLPEIVGLVGAIPK
jgi:hypothetical protein